MADKTFKLNTGQEIPALMFGTFPPLSLTPTGHPASPPLCPSPVSYHGNPH